MAKRSSFKPVVIYDTMGYIRSYQIAVCAEGEEVEMLMCDGTRLEVYTRGIIAGQIGEGARYGISEKDPVVLGLVFKDKALRLGATPDAIRLLGLLLPISKEELNTMADKKLAPKKGDAEGLKSAAKKAPVGGGKAAAAEKPAKKGNMEALEKARAVTAAKNEELKKDKRKITATEKGKAKAAKSEATDKLNIMIKAKTVGAAISSGDVAFKDIAYAEKVGLIELA